jgi:hypothetical protein
MSDDPRAVFFDLGDTLGTATLSGAPRRLLSFHLFPFVLPLLRQLKAAGLRLGVISNTGDDAGAAVDGVLATSGLLALLEPDLRIYSKDVGLSKKDGPEIFRLAAERAGFAGEPQRCVFVGEDGRERGFALAAGMRVSPHPLLVPELLDGQPSRFVRVTIPTAQTTAAYGTLRQQPFVALHIAGPGGRVVYGITSQKTATDLINMRFGVEFLGEPGLPDTSDLFLFRDDVASATGYLSAAGESGRFFTGPDNGRLLLSGTPEGLVIALPEGRSPGEFHFSEVRHGHTLRLMPDPLLLEPPVGGGAGAPGFLTGGAPASPRLAEAGLCDAAKQALAKITEADVLSTVGRYSGQQPLSGNDPEPVTSRHIAHVDNARVVAALAHELEALGGGRIEVRLIPFSHRGLALHNVEGELKGSSPELVLVTAHLDSTAANDPGYDEAHGAAPGADDDATGVAAVLMAARAFSELAAGAPPARTIRFVLFNAEEEGLVGSRVYARHQRTLEAPIVAVLQMDMIGFHEAPPRSWEVHAGFSPSAEVEARSGSLALVLRQVGPPLAPGLEAPQIYLSRGDPAGDPAAGRSDHAPFQAHGYAACVVSEDFFLGPEPESVPAQPNPHYHSAQDTGINAGFAADLARVVSGAAWLIASGEAGSGAPQFASSMQALSQEKPMPSRELDTSRSARRPAPTGSAGRIRLDGRGAATGPTPRVTQPGGPPALAADAGALPSAAAGSLVDRALDFVQAQRASLAGFADAAQDHSDFVPDPVVQTTSTGASAVHVQQHYRGLPVFRMGHTVRFSPQGRALDAAGESLTFGRDIDTEPKLDARSAVTAGATHLATTADPAPQTDEFGEVSTSPTLSIAGWEPRTVAAFPTLPSQPTVVDWVPAGTPSSEQRAPDSRPFENAIPAHLLLFDHPSGPRLAWYAVYTFRQYADQYAVIISADARPGEILYARQTLHQAAAQARVYEFSPGIADRIQMTWPRPLADYPVMPTAPLSGFPADWVESNETIGNSTRATLNFTTTTLQATPGSAPADFDPALPFGDDQKLLNIFYFCNYMHDFLYILGFDEAAGNFQDVNFTHTGGGGDPVSARAHSGPVNGTANMSTAADGLPPVMNMGLVTRTDRHTAFDADVVFHEYTHGLTNRLVGGTRQGHTLDAPQSRGLGEGWSDYFALTIQNFFRARGNTPEKTAIGDWVVNSPGGIRTALYDDAYPSGYGDVASFPRNPLTRLPDEHRTGEVWCAALMMMTRLIRAALRNDADGYRLAWTMVVDGLKLTPANPSFLQARDAILLAVDHLRDQRRIPPATHQSVVKAAWQAFAHFGMGSHASSGDAGFDAITADTTVPAEV